MIFRTEQPPAMPTLFSRWQSSLQSALRPSMWVPGIRNVHATWQKYVPDQPIISSTCSPRGSWQINRAPSDALSDFLAAVDTNQNQFNFVLDEVDFLDRITSSTALTTWQVDHHDNFARVFAYTRAEWLDVVEVKFIPSRDGCIAHVCTHIGC